MAAGVDSRRTGIVSKSIMRTKQFTLRTFEKAASTFSERTVDLRCLAAGCGRGAPLSRLCAACHDTSSFVHDGTKTPLAENKEWDSCAANVGRRSISACRWTVSSGRVIIPPGAGFVTLESGP